jgi:hypothetical protein
MPSQQLKITPCGKVASQPRRFAWGRVCPRCGTTAYNQNPYCSVCRMDVFEPEPTLCVVDGLQFVLRGDPWTPTPIKVEAQGRTHTDGEYWVCENQLFRVFGADLLPEHDLALLVQQAALRERKKLDALQRDLQALRRSTRAKTGRREPIPRHVRVYVWQRDRGKCVECGGQEKLEYDHIIPVSKGGSNTDRNIRLLCETCNRQKGQTI